MCSINTFGKFLMWFVYIYTLYRFRSSRPDLFCKKGVLRNFVEFTGKHLCQSHFLEPQACNFIKTETLAQVFSCEFCEISKNIFYYRTPSVAAFLAWMEIKGGSKFLGILLTIVHLTDRK